MDRYAEAGIIRFIFRIADDIHNARLAVIESEKYCGTAFVGEAVNIIVTIKQLYCSPQKSGC